MVFFLGFMASTSWAHLLTGLADRAFRRMEGEVGTADLSSMRECVLQEKLFKWGDAVYDAVLRKHVDRHWKKPAGFPYPAMGV